MLEEELKILRRANEMQILRILRIYKRERIKSEILRIYKRERIKSEEIRAELEVVSLE